MDYAFFESFTPDQATEFLNHFLAMERQALEELVATAERDGIHLDYSLASLPDVLKWMMRQVSFRWASLPPEEPEWIRKAHPHGVLEFDDASKAMISRAACYLGECFARLPGMRWTTGNLEYMEKNMPVVAGLRQGDELPPLEVVENLYSRIAGGDGPITDIDRAINAWMDRRSAPT